MPETTEILSVEAARCSIEAARYAGCQAAIGYTFRDPQLLEAALTHASGANHRLASNERLEFLGDAILGGIICERLFERFPDFLEGELTKLKSVVVSRLTCAKYSREMGLGAFLILGKGMTTAPDVPMSVLADVYESLVAAIYLDGGKEAVERFIDATITNEIDIAAAGESGVNYKSQLQHHAQREHGVTPTYHLTEERGPDHCKCFNISAQVGKRRFTPAWGRSKKESEQRAAENALCELRDEPAPHVGQDVDSLLAP
jgi:ribonuclease III